MIIIIVTPPTDKQIEGMEFLSKKRGFVRRTMYFYASS